MRRKKQYVPRDPIRDYFPLPNEIFSLGLSTGEIAVYAYLMYCEDRKTFQCHPSYSTIGKATGMTSKTVAKYVKSLQKRGLIDTEPTTVTLKDGRKHNGNLLYTILPIQPVVDRVFRNQLALAQYEAAVQKYNREHPDSKPIEFKRK